MITIINWCINLFKTFFYFLTNPDFNNPRILFWQGVCIALVIAAIFFHQISKEVVEYGLEIINNFIKLIFSIIINSFYWCLDLIEDSFVGDWIDDHFNDNEDNPFAVSKEKPTSGFGNNINVPLPREPVKPLTLNQLDKVRLGTAKEHIITKQKFEHQERQRKLDHHQKQLNTILQNSSLN